MKFLQTLAIIFLMATPCLAAEPIQKVRLPLEVKVEMRSSTVPKEIEGKQWNRWTSKNFTVLSLDDVQAQYLHRHLEQIKSWILARWGLYDVDFSAECKLICVDDPALFEKLFKIKDTRVEVRRENGKIKETVIFLLLNGPPSQTVPVHLSEVVVAEFAQKYNANFGWWTYRGMSLLNGTLDQIRSELRDLKPLLENNKPLYFSEGLLTMTREQYYQLSEENRRLFDKSAMCFCLLLRKEFGQDKTHFFLKKSSDANGEAALKEVLGFKDGYDQFDRSFKRYMIDITRDVLSGKTPDHYLQIRAKDVTPSSSFFSSASS